MKTRYFTETVFAVYDRYHKLLDEYSTQAQAEDAAMQDPDCMGGLIREIEREYRVYPKSYNGPEEFELASEWIVNQYPVEAVA